MNTSTQQAAGLSLKHDERLVCVRLGDKKTPALFPREGRRGWAYSMLNLNDIADSDQPVLLTGETGVGKELLARYLHDYSPRSGKPFITVNCSVFSADRMQGELFGWKRGSFSGAVTDHSGFVAKAEGGTLFLDEIGNLDISLQGYLLRFMQDGEYQPLADTCKKSQVRVIAATSKPSGVVDDLKQRFQFSPLEIPPLRERGDDIFRLLIQPGFIDQRKYTGITLRTLSRLANDPWPGNIRQLANYCKEKALRASPTQSRGSMPPYVMDDPMPQPERDNWFFFAAFCLRMLEHQWLTRQSEFQENPHIANTTRLLLTLAEYDEASDLRTDVVSLPTLVDMLQDSDRGRYHVYDFRFLNEGLREKHPDFENGIARRWGDCALPDALVLIRDYVKTFVRIVPRAAYPDREISEKFEKAINAMISIPPFETPQPPPKPIEIDESKLRKHPLAVVEKVIVLYNAGLTPKQIQLSLSDSLTISQIKGILRTHSEHTSGRPKSRGGRPPK